MPLKRNSFFFGIHSTTIPSVKGLILNSNFVPHFISVYCNQKSFSYIFYNQPH